MLFTLLDVVDEKPGFLNRNGNLLIVIAIVALVALAGYFMWKRKRNHNQ